MKKVKPNLKNMFNFHTIILVMFVVVVSTKIEAKLQTYHTHHHSHNYKHHNVVVVGGEGSHVDDNIKEEQEQHHKHQHHSHHQQHHHHHPHRAEQEQQQQQYIATPKLEFTTSSSSSSSDAALNSDNEFLIKQQDLPLTNKDENYYKTKDLKSSSSSTSSTTSKPSLSIQLMKQNADRHVQTSSSNSNITSTTSLQSQTLSNSRRDQQHTHLKHYNSNNRLISTPSSKHYSNSGIDNKRTDKIATMYSELNENSKLNFLATKLKDTQLSEQHEPENHHKNHNEHHHQLQQQQHPLKKPDFDNEKPALQNYDDYYSDVGEDDEEVDEDDYIEDDGDNDNIDGNSYDVDKNLSDRSYARITRSKLDDDYIDDEPYRNGINELLMQRDAADGDITERKYLEVGNEKAVQQARERFIQEKKRPRTPHELATEHWHRMIQATKCRKPMPRVIPISNNTSKRYEPYATILHRCGDDTGCCGSTASVCTVKRHEIVMVYVFSYDFNYRKEIEALQMQNHTECHCVNRGSLLHDSMPRDKRSGGSVGDGGFGNMNYLHHHFQRQQRKHQQQQHRQLQFQSPSSQFHHEQQLQNMLDCHCPRHFNVFEEDVERHAHLPKPHSVFIRKCHCDCLVNNQTCLRFKHGEEGFSLEDRKCILERNCKPPVCSYGEYNLRTGRCPSYYRSHLLQTT